MKAKEGVTILEFSLAGIPALFVFISAIEMALGMWQYHTLGYAMKEATRNIISHGQGCQMSGNSCGQTIGTITTQIANTAIGIPASSLNVTFTSASGVVQTCAPLTSCLTSIVSWPPVTNNDNLQGKNVTTTGSFTLAPTMSMFWPGTQGSSFQPATFTASSTQQIMF